MKNISRIFVFALVAALFFISNSCDKFDTFELNVPFPIEVVTQGSANPSVSTSDYCLNQSETFRDIVEDIKKVTFVEAAWRTDSVKNITSGTVSVKLEEIGGAVLFQKTLPGTNPADYKSKPFILSFTETEITILNNYFNQYIDNPNRCLRATVTATVQTGTAPYYLKGYVDLLVSAETEL